MSADAAEAFLLGHRALAAVPIVVVDALAAWWLFHVESARSPDGPRGLTGAMDLAAFFACLALLAFGQVLTHSLLDPSLAFFFMHGWQSTAVTLSAVPLVRFAHRFIDESYPREARASVGLTLAVAAVASVVFVARAVQPHSVPFDVVIEQPRLPIDDEAPWSIFLTVFLLVTYGYALVVLLRKARGLDERARHGARRFALVVAAAICAVIINRLESIDVVPPGTYTTYMLFVTLGAVLIFLVATDEMTQFRDRIAALVVVGMLGPVSMTMLLATDALAHTERESTALAHARAHAAASSTMAGVHVRPADADSPSIGIVGNDPRTARIVIDVSLDGQRFLVESSYLLHRRALHRYAWPAALVVVLASLFALVVVPRLAEWSVLRPLARLLGAEAASREKSIFLAGMSHELRTPLQTISHHAAKLVEDPTREREDVAARAAAIDDSASHLLTLIETLLLAGRHDAVSHPVRREELPIASLVEPVVAAHRVAAERKGVLVTAEIDEGLGPLARVDARIVRQVLSNLVGNAVKFTDAGQVLVIVRPGEARDIDLVVVDTGRGIPPVVRARLFEPFYQHDPRDGVGLGLALVRTLVDAIDGTIDVESTPHVGTKVRVTLPDARVDASSAASFARAWSARSVGEALSADVRAELLALARVGDVLGLRARVRALCDEGGDREALSHLDELLSRYQLRAVRSLLDSVES